MKTLAVEDITMTLPELIDTLAPGEEVILTRNAAPIAKLMSEPTREPRVAGICKGMVLYTAPDFDAPLEDMKEYME